MTAPTSKQIALPSGLSADVLSKGNGAPLVFLHGVLGRSWSPFLDDLAERHTVYAPLHPGSADPEELNSFDGLSDLALFYDDLFRALNLAAPVVIGHSFGGMIAAELAGYFPERISKLILIDALGLWIDETPIGDLSGTNPINWGKLLFADPASATAIGTLMPPEDAAARADFMVSRMLSVAAASHFIWPIPDRNLRRRLYRIKAPTLLLWGAQDAYVPPVYAKEFANGIQGSRIAIIESAGHFPYLENREATTKQVLSFVAG